MLVAAFTWGDLWRLALAVFLLAVGLSFAYLLVRLGGTVGRLSAFISGAEREILPVINKVGGSVDRVNGQLDKVDKITDSAVDAADSVDTAVRAVSRSSPRSCATQAPSDERRGSAHASRGGGLPADRASRRRRVRSPRRPHLRRPRRSSSRARGAARVPG